jgi:hypothetical protein
MSAEHDAALLCGEWVDEDGDRHRISAVGETFQIKSWDGNDGEVFEVQSVTWRPGGLRWTVRVPSTGYVLNYRTHSIAADRLEIRWKNAAADPKKLGISRISGTETFRRPSTRA